MTAETMTLMVPYRNYPIAPFRIALESMRRQTRPFDEIVVSDFASREPFKGDMRRLCREYEQELGIKYIYTAVESTEITDKVLDKILSVHLWQLNWNIGIRNSTSDLIVMSGIDRVFDDGVADIIFSFYNHWSGNSRVGEAWLSGRVKNLHRVPQISELDNFEKLMDEAKPRGGYGFIATSKKWLHKVQGLDESIRWCADIDLAMRAKFDGVPVIWISHGRAANRAGRYGWILHVATHGRSIRKFGGADVTDVARRGKWFIHRTHCNRKIVRNDEDWGILTDEKVRSSLQKTKMTREELDESLRIRREDPKKWLEIYA